VADSEWLSTSDPAAKSSTPQLDIYSLLPSQTTQAAHNSNTTELNAEFKNAAISLKKSAAFSAYRVGQIK